MEPVKKFFATLIFSILYRPHLLMAQEEEIFIDNLEVQDSSFLEMPFMSDSVINDTGSASYVIIILAALVVIAAAAYFILKKKYFKGT